MRVNVPTSIAVLAGTLVVGAAVGISAYAWLVEQRQSQSPASLASLTTTKLETRAVATTRPSAPASSDIDAYLFVQSVLDSTKLESDFDQSVSMYLLLARADEGDLERYINESFSISSRNQRVAALSIIFGRYAVVDPRKAVDRALALNQVTMQEKSNLVRSIFNEWTVGDIDAATLAIENLPQQFRFSAASAVMWRTDFLSVEQRIQLAEQIGPNDAWIANTVAAIRSEASKTDPRLSFYDHIRDTSQTQERNVELLRIVRHWFEQEGPAVLSEIQVSLDNPNTRNFVLTNLIWNAIGSKTASPAAILSVVSEFPNRKDAKQATEHVFRSWSILDPKESFEASFEFDDQLVTHDFRSSLLQAWAAKDADELLTEASSLPREYRNTAVVNALGRIARATPDEAVRYARNLDTRHLRLLARDEIIRQWSSVDAKSAFEWLMNDGFSTDEQDVNSIWRSAFSAYLNQDFESAQKHANQYQGELKHQFVASVARHLIKSDLDLAIDYVQEMDKESQIEMQIEIGEELVQLDPGDALAYAETIEEQHRDHYYDLVINTWAFTDFFSLHQNIQRIPRKYRAYAAKYLLRINERKSHLNDRQIRELEDMVPTETGVITSFE